MLKIPTSEYFKSFEEFLKYNDQFYIQYFLDRSYCKNRIHLIAKYGSLKWLKYAWNSQTYEIAAENGHLDCLQYVHEKGCPWGEETFLYTAKYGHLNFLHCVHKHGCSWNKNNCYWVSRNSHLCCLQYTLENGCHWNINMFIFFWKFNHQKKMKKTYFFLTK